MYKEKYELRKIKDPEKAGTPGKHYSVLHYTPIEGGTCLACAGTKYFETLEEAEAYQQEREARLTEKEGKKAMTKTEDKKAMSEAARLARNAYKRKWAKENPDKVRESNRKYWERKAQEAAAEEG